MNSSDFPLTFEIHGFSNDIAIRHGLLVAYFVQNIKFWVLANVKARRNHKDGLTWTYNSQRALIASMPVFTRQRLRTVIRQSIDAGLIVVANYNKMGADKTSWYSLTEYGASFYPELQQAIKLSPMSAKQLEEHYDNVRKPRAAPLSENVAPLVSSNPSLVSSNPSLVSSNQPIPDTNPDVNPDKTHTHKAVCVDNFSTTSSPIDGECDIDTHTLTAEINKVHLKPESPEVAHKIIVEAMVADFTIENCRKVYKYIQKAKPDWSQKELRYVPSLRTVMHSKPWLDKPTPVKASPVFEEIAGEFESSELEKKKQPKYQEVLDEREKNKTQYTPSPEDAAKIEAAQEQLKGVLGNGVFSRVNSYANPETQHETRED